MLILRCYCRTIITVVLCPLSYADHSLVYHSGSTFGYNSLLTLVPESGLAIFTSMNTNDKSKMARHAIHMFIMDLLLAGESELNPTNVCQTPPPWFVKATTESNPHTGKYSNRSRKSK